MKPVLSRTIYMQDGEEYKWVMEMFNVVEVFFYVKKDNIVRKSLLKKTQEIC